VRSGDEDAPRDHEGHHLSENVELHGGCRSEVSIDTTEDVCEEKINLRSRFNINGGERSECGAWSFAWHHRR
jgi:hypothetical protein